MRFNLASRTVSTYSLIIQEADCCCSVTKSFPTLCDPMDCSTSMDQTSTSSTISQSLLKFMSIESVMPSNHLIFCRPLLLPPSFPSIRVFSNESALCIRWPHYQSFGISPSSEYPGLISFRIDWFDLLVVHGTLKRVFSSTTIWKRLQCSGFFMVQLSPLYLTTGKTIALTRQTFVSKVMSLLFNTLPRFVIAFLPRSKNLLISWLQSPSAVILEPKKLKSVTASTFHLSICQKKQMEGRIPWYHSHL